MGNTRSIPVRQWLVRLDGPITDEAAAIEGWHALVRAQGWSPVGDPEVISQPQFGEFGVVGRLVQYPGLTVSPDVNSAILVPA